MKDKYNKFEFSTFNGQKGSVLLIAFVSMGILLILGLYFLDFTLVESKIAKSRVISDEAFYLAEAGINEGIWKIKHGDWATCFVTTTASCPDCNTTWTASFVNDQLVSNATITVTLIRPECGRGELIATSTLYFGGKRTQRVVKTKVFKALGSLTENSSIFGNGNLIFTNSKLNAYNGNIYSSGNINISSGSIVNIFDNYLTPEQEGQALANGNINGSLTSSSTCASNICQGPCESCPAPKYNFPAVNFDEGENSYKARAQNAQENNQCSVIGKNSVGEVVVTSNNCIFSETEFLDLLRAIGGGGTVILNFLANGLATSTYYVNGKIDLKGNRKLIVNGILVASESITIGDVKNWAGGDGPSHLEIHDPGTGIPSGLLTKGNIKFGQYSAQNDIRIEGLIYSLGNIDFSNLPNYRYEIYGGVLAAGNIRFTQVDQQPVNLYLENDIIREGIWGGPEPPPGVTPTFSPVVTIEYWEESY